MTKPGRLKVIFWLITIIIRRLVDKGKFGPIISVLIGHCLNDSSLLLGNLKCVIMKGNSGKEKETFEIAGKVANGFYFKYLRLSIQMKILVFEFFINETNTYFKMNKLIFGKIYFHNCILKTSNSGYTIFFRC